MKYLIIIALCFAVVYVMDQDYKVRTEELR